MQSSSGRWVTLLTKAWPIPGFHINPILVLTCRYRAFVDIDIVTSSLNIRELKQRRRQRQRKRHAKIYFYFICATSRFNISTHSTFTKMVNFPGTKLVGVAYKLRKKMKNSPWCVHVLHKTLNVVISRCCFAEDGKEMYQNVKRTRRAVVFAH